MTRPAFNLAIETSGRHGSVALGRGDELLGVRALGEKRRHNLGLMPAVDELCREHGASPRDLDEVYVSLGPGSFTGLRVGLATAKMLALAGGGGTRLVGVETLEVLARQALDPTASRAVPGPGSTRSVEARTVAVALNVKHGTAYSGVWAHAGAGGGRGDAAALNGGARVVVEPGLRTLEELWALAPRPVGVIAEKLDDAALPAGVTRLPVAATVARAEMTWRVGRELANSGEFADAATLSPLYVREPEAVTLWDAREKSAAEPRR